MEDKNSQCHMRQQRGRLRQGQQRQQNFGFDCSWHPHLQIEGISKKGLSFCNRSKCKRHRLNSRQQPSLVRHRILWVSHSSLKTPSWQPKTLPVFPAGCRQQLCLPFKHQNCSEPAHPDVSQGRTSSLGCDRREASPMWFLQLLKKWGTLPSCSANPFQLPSSQSRLPPPCSAEPIGTIRAMLLVSPWTC